MDFFQPDDLTLVTEEEDGDVRLFFANYTSSLLAVNTTLLLIALAATAGLAVLAYIFYTLTQTSSSGYGSSGGGGYGYGETDYEDYRGYRTRRAAEDSWVRILSMLDAGSSLYSGLSSQKDSMACLKKAVCEALSSPSFPSSPSPPPLLQLASSILPDNSLLNDNSLDTGEGGNCASLHPACSIDLEQAQQKMLDLAEEMIATL